MRGIPKMERTGLAGRVKAVSERATSTSILAVMEASPRAQPGVSELSSTGALACFLLFPDKHVLGKASVILVFSKDSLFFLSCHGVLWVLAYLIRTSLLGYCTIPPIELPLPHLQVKLLVLVCDRISTFYTSHDELVPPRDMFVEIRWKIGQWPRAADKVIYFFISFVNDC